VHSKKPVYARIFLAGIVPRVGSAFPVTVSIAVAFYILLKNMNMILYGTETIQKTSCKNAQLKLKIKRVFKTYDWLLITVQPIICSTVNF
jgi:hypothetical protein